MKRLFDLLLAVGATTILLVPITLIAILVKLTPEAREKLLRGNYERLFDAAKTKVRAWEKLHANDSDKVPVPAPVSGVGNHQ